MSNEIIVQSIENKETGSIAKLIQNGEKWRVTLSLGGQVEANARGFVHLESAKRCFQDCANAVIWT